MVAELKLAVINDAIEKNKERFEVTEWRLKNRKVNVKKRHLFNQLLQLKMQMMVEMGVAREGVVEEWQEVLTQWNDVVLWKRWMGG